MNLDLPGLDSTSADVPTLWLLYALVRYYKPALIVEAGTYKGHAALVMASAMQEEGVDGEVWTADTKDYGARELAHARGLGDIVNVWDGDFRQMLAIPLKDRRIRFAFVDSGMEIENGQNVAGCPTNLRIEHCNAVLTRLAPRGLLIVDDAMGDWVGAPELRRNASLLLPQHKGIAIFQLSENP